MAKPLRCRLAAIVLICSLLAACSGSNSDARPTQQTSPPAATLTRDYWPTNGWRTAAARDHGVDPAGLATVEEHVAKAYPQVRSILIVRHGYLVYEHYRQGLDQADGHDVRSITKSVTGALVGIALAEGKIKSLDQTVGELLAAQLPKDADPRFAAVTVKQLLTMTSGVAGDYEGTGGDPRLADAMQSSPDWIRHILGQRLDTEPGTNFAYSDRASHLLSAIVANVSGQSTLEFARAKLFNPLGIRTDGAYEPVLSDHVDAATVKAYERATLPGRSTPRATTTPPPYCGCPRVTWPNSVTSTSTAADGTATSSSRPTTWPAQPHKPAPHPTSRWDTAGFGGSPPKVATARSPRAATAVRLSTSSPTWTW